MKTITDHDKLWEIAELIGYKLPIHWNPEQFWDFNYKEAFYNRSVRDIIFNFDFLDAYYAYYLRKHNKLPNIWIYRKIVSELMQRLDDPVDYLADLIWITD